MICCFLSNTRTHSDGSLTNSSGTFCGQHRPSGLRLELFSLGTDRPNLWSPRRRAAIKLQFDAPTRSPGSYMLQCMCVFVHVRLQMVPEPHHYGRTSEQQLYDLVREVGWWIIFIMYDDDDAQCQIGTVHNLCTINWISDMQSTWHIPCSCQFTNSHYVIVMGGDSNFSLPSYRPVCDVWYIW